VECPGQQCPGTKRKMIETLNAVKMKGLIKLCYRKVIDISSTSAWDKYVFDDTYKEFYMQAQQFDQQKKYGTFQEMVKNIPSADQMHYLVSTAAVNYIRQLNGLFPDVLNVLGKRCIPFENFKFEIVESHIKNKDQHKVSICFYSDALTWIDTIDNQLLFAAGDQTEALYRGQALETEMVLWRSNLTVHSFQQIRVPLAFRNSEN